MTREQKLEFHLQMVILEDRLNTPLNAKQIEAFAASATSDQKERAYKRALTRNPILLEDERWGYTA